MAGGHAHGVVAAHLVRAAHVAHLHLVLAVLLVEVVHLAVVRGVVVLAVIMVWRRVVAVVGVPVCEGVVRLVLVTQRRVTRRRHRGRRCRHHAARVAAQRRQVAVGPVHGLVHLGGFFLDRWRH